MAADPRHFGRRRGVMPAPPPSPGAAASTSRRGALTLKGASMRTVFENKAVIRTEDPADVEAEARAERERRALRELARQLGLLGVPVPRPPDDRP
jgi:hypothetical protein